MTPQKFKTRSLIRDQIALFTRPGQSRRVLLYILLCSSFFTLLSTGIQLYTDQGVLNWLWVMANRSVAYFMIHKNRSKEAFLALVKDWEGILVSDNYGVYQKWANLRQFCLAHLIRKATALSEKKDEKVSPTNNHAERTLRFGVLWRKRSKGTQSSKGNQWVERILSFKHTCSIRSLNSFPILVDLMNSYFKKQEPDLSWL